MYPNADLLRNQRRQVGRADAVTFFNMLTDESLFATGEALLPLHRERLFPPTETLAMFLAQAQAMSADRSCQKAVDAAAVKRLVTGGCRLAAPQPAAIAGPDSDPPSAWSRR